MVVLEGIKKTHPRMAKCYIEQLINFGNQKGVFRAGLIQIGEINTNLPFT